MKIKIIVTGGTIAKRYDEISGDLLFDRGHIDKMLFQGRCRADIELKNIMFKDSLDMNEDDRSLIYDECIMSENTHILVTHGTDTMVESAAVLSSIPDKTIVLTGSMIPYTFNNSDALFNFGFALGALQNLDAGIYICMNGKIFSWDKVKKDKLLGEFV
jgi:L-asparaginase